MRHQKHLRNNWLDPIFSFHGDCHTKGLLVLLHSGLESITEVHTDPKEGFVLFQVTLLPLVTQFSVFMRLQGMVPGNIFLGDLSLKDYRIIWKIQMKEMKTK